MILPGTGRGTAGAAGGGGGGRQAPRSETVTARKLRREMTLPEVLLWQRLRGNVAGMRFRRQHPIGPYFVDFYCSVARLVVEIDGAIHDHRQDGDAIKDGFLRENGFTVVRLMAGNVLSDPDRAAESIIALAARPLHHQPAAGGPPPRAGEELR